MIKTRDIMTKSPVAVSPETKITKAAELLITNKFNGLPVVDDTGKLVGIICRSDLVAQQKKLPLPSFFIFLDGIITTSSSKHIEKQAKKISATVVKDAMSKNPVTITPDTSIETVATLMVDKSLHTLPVVDKDVLVGVVGKEDVLKTIISDKDKED